MSAHHGALSPRVRVGARVAAGAAAVVNAHHGAWLPVPPPSAAAVP